MGPGATVARHPGCTLAGALRDCANTRPGSPCSRRVAPVRRNGPKGSDEVVRAPERGCGLEVLGGLLEAGRAPREQRRMRVVVGSTSSARWARPAATTRQNAPARSRATARSPWKTPLRIASVSSRSASGVGGSAAPAITLATGATCWPAREVGGRLAWVTAHPLAQRIEAPQGTRQRAGRSLRPEPGDGVEAVVVDQPHQPRDGARVGDGTTRVDQGLGGRMSRLCELSRVRSAPEALHRRLSEQRRAARPVWLVRVHADNRDRPGRRLAPGRATRAPRGSARPVDGGEKRGI